MSAFPNVLVPFNRAEGMAINYAAREAGVHPATMRRWCEEFGLGRRIGRPWIVSRAALKMHLNGDRRALRAYHAGDRTSDLVAGYFR
jgi:hypothetical protein